MSSFKSLFSAGIQTEVPTKSLFSKVSRDLLDLTPLTFTIFLVLLHESSKQS